MNELMTFDEMDHMFENQLDLYNQQIKLTQRLATSFKVFKEQYKKDLQLQNVKFDELKNELDKHKEEMNQKQEVAINSIRLKSRVEGYVNLKTFGDSFLEGVSVGSRTIGKLFRVIGLALRSKDTTIPYEHFQGFGKYAETRTNDVGYNYYVWNYEKCILKLDKWLEENNLKEQFYSISDKNKMEIFINKLHREYVENQRNKY